MITLDSNDIVNTTKTETFLTKKITLFALTLHGSNYNTSSLSWARIVIDGTVVCSCLTTDIGLGQSIIINKNTTITYSLRCGDISEVSPSIKYREFNY